MVADPLRKLQTQAIWLVFSFASLNPPRPHSVSRVSSSHAPRYVYQKSQRPLWEEFLEDCPGQRGSRDKVSREGQGRVIKTHSTMTLGLVSSYPLYQILAGIPSHQPEKLKLLPPSHLLEASMRGGNANCPTATCRGPRRKTQEVATREGTPSELPRRAADKRGPEESQFKAETE